MGNARPTSIRVALADNHVVALEVIMREALGVEAMQSGAEGQEDLEVLIHVEVTADPGIEVQDPWQVITTAVGMRDSPTSLGSPRTLISACRVTASSKWPLSSCLLNNFRHTGGKTVHVHLGVSRLAELLQASVWKGGEVGERDTCGCEVPGKDPVEPSDS